MISSVTSAVGQMSIVLSQNEDFKYSWRFCVCSSEILNVWLGISLQGIIVPLILAISICLG